MEPSTLVSTLGAPPGAAIRPASAAWAAAGYVLCGVGFLAAVGLGMDPGAFPAGAPLLAVSAALLLAPLAVLAMVLYSPASFEVYQRGGRFICVAVFLPFAAPFFVNRFQGQVDPYWLIAPAAIAAIVVFVPAWLIKDRAGLAGPRAFAAIVAICAGLYAYGAITYADTRFDQSAVTPSPTQVLAKWESHGRSTSYDLKLAPWGPFDHPITVSVSSGLYSAVSEGDQVCMLLHPGAVGLAWYETRACGDA